MMRTNKLSSKRVGVAPPEIEALVSKVVDAGIADLPATLRALIPPKSPYTYPRADLHAFIPLLDRFDGLLKDIIAEYEIDTFQNREFEDGTKDLVLEILRVERLVMDNTTSRKIYSSYDRLQSLLFTSDLQVLHATILLLLRPAQQYSSHTPFELSHNSIVKSRLLRIAEGGLSRTWGKAKEEGWGLKEFEAFARGVAGDAVEDAGEEMETEETEGAPVGAKKLAKVPEDWFNIQMSFYIPSSVSDKRSSEDVIAAEEVKGPTAAELEKPTQDLTLRSGSSSQVDQVAEASASAGRQSMVVESAGELDTPVKPRGGASGRAGLSLGQSGSMGDIAGSAPSTPPAAAKNQAATPSKPSGATAHNSDGVLTTSAFSRCFTNPDGQVTLSISAAGMLPLVQSDIPSGTMVIMRRLLGHHPELKAANIREELFELVCRMRVILALRPMQGDADVTDRREEMRLLIEVRITALATYLHLSPEDVAQSDLFLYDTSVITQLSDLINPKKNTDDRVLAAVFVALDACARYKSRVSEVLTAVNANVAHGTLLAGFASLIKRLQTDEDVPHDLVDAEIAFVSFAATASGYASMLIGAGILPVLIECFKIRGINRGGYVARAIGLIDSVLYGSGTAFNVFVAAGGIGILNERISFEIDRFLDPIATPDDVSYHELVRRSTPLKLSLRSLHRMMQAPGTTEGLRNLIDSELPKSLKRIFENPHKVGSPSLAIAINITATFVHNEPTSLSVILEMKLPQALYDAIEAPNKASFELLSATTNALSALCLNQAGMDLTLSRPKIIGNLVDCARDPEYRDILGERDNAIFIGSALDELARHHIPLKPIVLEATTSMLKRLLQSGLDGHSKGITSFADYGLVPSAKASSEAMEVRMSGSVEGESPANDSVASQDLPPKEDVEAAEKMQVEEELAAVAPAIKAKGDGEKREMHFDSCVELACQIMQGLFHNQSLARDFVRVDGHKLVLKILASPALLAQQSTTETMHAVSSTLKVLAEASLSTVLHSVIKSCRKAMEAVKPLWQRPDLFQTSFFSAMLDSRNSTVLASQNAAFRNIVHLNNLLGALSTLYAVVGYGHTKVTVAFLQQIGSGQHSSFLDSLGALHRVCLWENIHLKVNHGTKAASAVTSTPAHGTPQPRPLPDQVLSPSIEVTEEQAGSASQATQSEGTLTATETAAKAEVPTAAESEATARSISPNYANVKYVAHRIPASLAPFFQGLIRMLVVKRVDPAHKKEAVPTAYRLAKVLLKHLNRISSPDTTVTRGYTTAMIGLVTILLFDERGTSSTLQVALLNSFSRQGGLNALAQNLGATVEELGRLPLKQRTADEPIAGQDELQLWGQLKMGMDLIKGLVGTKIFECPHMPTLVTRDGDAKRPDYFNPSTLLVDVRLALFETVTSVWDAEWLAAAPVLLIKSTVQAVNLIMSAVPEPPAAIGVPLASSSAGLLGIPAPPPAPRTPFVLNEAYYTTLQEMGFTANQSRFALTRLNNNLPGATEYLLTHAHLITDTTAANPPAAVAPAAPDPPPPPAPPVEAVAVQIPGDDVDMSSDSEAGGDEGAVI